MPGPLASDYEDRLVDILAVREACRRHLNPRRQCIVRKRGEGFTLREIARDLRVSVERIRQEELAAHRILMRPQAGLSKTLWLPPLSAPAIISPPQFDKAAFLAHMRDLVRTREARAREAVRLEAERAQRALDAEYEVLRGVVRGEEEEIAEAARRAQQQQALRQEERRWAEQEAERWRQHNEAFIAYQQKVQDRWSPDGFAARQAQGFAALGSPHLHAVNSNPADSWQQWQWYQLLASTHGAEAAKQWVDDFNRSMSKLSGGQL